MRKKEISVTPHATMRAMPTTITRPSLRPTTGPVDEPSSFAAEYPLATKLALVATWIVGFLIAYDGITAVILGGIFAQDSHAYWLAAQGDLQYERVAGQKDAFLYSPLFLSAIRPLAVLPWPLFLAAWIALLTAVLAWLLKPLQLRWALPVFLLCLPELLVGNIFILLGAAAVLGLKHPSAWTFAILTKVTTGVGLLWFLVRGDWRRLRQGATVAVALLALSYTLEPGHWRDWVSLLLEGGDGITDGRTGILLRCLLATALVVVGARKHWPWLIAPAMVLATPVLVSYPALTILAAVPRLLLMEKEAPGPIATRFTAERVG
jgi:Glycosyltransferase family 87